MLVKRLREVAAGEMELPRSSSVGTMAMREFDTAGQDMDRLSTLINEADALVNSHAR